MYIQYYYRNGAEQFGPYIATDTEVDTLLAQARSLASHFMNAAAADRAIYAVKCFSSDQTLSAVYLYMPAILTTRKLFKTQATSIACEFANCCVLSVKREKRKQKSGKRMPRSKKRMTK